MNKGALSVIRSRSITIEQTKIRKFCVIRPAKVAIELTFVPPQINER